jgi:hypothetical protein
VTQRAQKNDVFRVAGTSDEGVMRHALKHR